MIIYCDGGTKYSPDVFGQNNVLVSWGIRIEDPAGNTELMGSRILPRKIGMVHEFVAFAEAVIYAHTHNGNTLNTKFFTDCDKISDLKKPHLREELYLPSPRTVLTIEAISSLYSKPTLKLIEQYLIFAQINWIKGHRKCVNHNRADYLATVSRQIAEGTIREIMPFEDWLQEGKQVWGTSIWYPAFCGINTRLPNNDVQPRANVV